MVADATTTRGSRYSFQCSVPGGGTRYAYTPFLAANGTNNIYVKFDWYMETDAFGSNQPIIFEFLDASLNRNAQLRFIGFTNVLEVLNASDTSVITGPTISTGQWYQIELSFIYSAGGSTSELKVNGVSYGSAATGVSGVSNHATHVLWGATESASGGTSVMYFDNIIVNDSTGSSETSWVGDQRVLQAHPVAMGDAVTDTDASPYLWQTSGGGLTSGDLTNWNRVDEVQPDDNTTYSRANLGQHYFDIYAVETRATVGHVAATDAITFVNVMGKMAGTGGTSRPFRYFFQYDSSGTGATYTGDLEANANAWFWGDVNDKGWSILHPLYPSSKVGSDLDSMEIGVYKNDGTSRTVNVSTIWLEFTYQVPAPAATANYLSLLGVGT